MPVFLVIRQYVHRFLMNNIRPIIVGFVALVAVGTVGSYLAERGVNPGFQNLWDSFWWTMVTVATVGYGDKVPITVAGRLVGILCLLGGPVLLASALGAMGVAWYDRWTKGVRGMNQVKDRDHVVICGWNEKAAQILTEIRSSRDLKHVPVTIIDSRIESKPTGDPEVSFVRGNAADLNTLQQANIAAAKYAIVLAESSAPEADQKTVLTVLAIEKSNPSIVSSAELNVSGNASHLQRAGCDIIVNSTDLTGRLLAMSLLNPSITQVVTDLVSGEGDELYRCALPARLAGKTFGGLLADCKQRCGVIVIGIEREGKCILNPPSDTQARSGDQLLVIAPEPPRPCD